MSDGVLALKGTLLWPDPGREEEEARIRTAADRELAAIPVPPAEAPPIVRSVSHQMEWDITATPHGANGASRDASKSHHLGTPRPAVHA